MATLSLGSGYVHSEVFHFDIYGGVSAGAFAMAMMMSFQNGDFSAIPALIGLAVMALIVFSVHAPLQTRASGRPCGRIGREAVYRTHLWRRHCLEQ